MNDGQLDDLKQFIDSRISQSEARFDTKLDELRKEVAEGFAGVGDAIEEIHARAEEMNAIVDKRLTRLEPLAT